MRINQGFMQRFEVRHWAAPAFLKVILGALFTLGYIIALPFFAVIGFTVLIGYRLGRGLVSLRYRVWTEEYHSVRR